MQVAIMAAIKKTNLSFFIVVSSACVYMLGVQDSLRNDL